MYAVRNSGCTALLVIGEEASIPRLTRLGREVSGVLTPLILAVVET
jgi:hypothetical protein